jgi:hypothetical protein
MQNKNNNCLGARKNLPIAKQAIEHSFICFQWDAMIPSPRRRRRSANHPNAPTLLANMIRPNGPNSRSRSGDPSRHFA